MQVQGGCVDRNARDPAAIACVAHQRIAMACWQASGHRMRAARLSVSNALKVASALENNRCRTRNKVTGRSSRTFLGRSWTQACTLPSSFLARPSTMQTPAWEGRPIPSLHSANLDTQAQPGESCHLCFSFEQLRWSYPALLGFSREAVEWAQVILHACIESNIIGAHAARTARRSTSSSLGLERSYCSVSAASLLQPLLSICFASLWAFSNRIRRHLRVQACSCACM
jgi:hypothetical protein